MEQAEGHPFPAADDERERLVADVLMGDDRHEGRWHIIDQAGAWWALRQVARARAAMVENGRTRAAEVDRIDRWLQRENEGWQRTAAFFEAHLAMWHQQRLDEDPKAKTIRTPYGSLHYRAQPPELVYDEDALLDWLAVNRTDLVRVKTEVNKADLKRAVEFEREADGVLRVILKDTGEVVEGVRAVEQPPAFAVKVFDIGGLTEE